MMRSIYSIIYNPATGLFEDDFSEYALYGYKNAEEFKAAFNKRTEVYEAKHHHNWKAYLGFTEKYDFCKCGEKKEYSGN